MLVVNVCVLSVRGLALTVCGRVLVVYGRVLAVSGSVLGVNGMSVEYSSFGMVGLTWCTVHFYGEPVCAGICHCCPSIK